MKKLLLKLALISCLNLFAQNCKYEINEVDEFTKKTILETKEQTLSRSFNFYTAFSFKKIDDKKFLKLFISSTSIFSIRENHEIIFITDGDNSVILKFIQSKVSRGKYDSNSRITIWSETFYLPIDEETFQRLSNENILKLRVYTSDGYIDDEVKEKHAKKFKEQIICIK